MRLSGSTDAIVPVLGGGAFNGHSWLATSAGGQTALEDLLPGFRAGANGLFLDVAGLLNIAAVLDRAHAEGFAHGDLGPHTVAVAGQGTTVLQTFGFHRIFGEPTDPDAGGARYRAPELFEGRRVDRRTDVYGLGMLLYCILPGRRPFEGREALVKCALYEMPEPLDGVSDSVNAVLAQALAKARLGRHRTGRSGSQNRAHRDVHRSKIHALGRVHRREGSVRAAEPAPHLAIA